MENVRIAVLSAYDTTLAFLDNLAPESMHYYSDELHIYMEGAASTYMFRTNAKHPESTHLIEGNKLSFQYRHKDYYFNIMRVTRDEYEVEVEAYSLVFELLNEEKGPYKAAKAMSFAEYLTAFNYEQTVNLGVNEVSDKKIKHEWTGTETLLARLYSLANVFNAEVEFVPKLNEDYSLKNIKMNAYIEHSDKDQGIGSDRTDIVLRYGKNVSGITKTSDITELYTAIRPTGKDGLTVMALDKKELDANGDVEYLSPKNNGNIYAVQAKDRFPSNLMANENERYIAKIWEYDTDNVNTLYGQALAQLKKNCVPQVQYEVEGYFDTDIGDTVTIADEEYNPPLYLQARVTEQSRSFTDPSQNKTTFDNFKELQSRIDPSLINAVKQMVAANKTYTCSILTDNGIVFKNGEGSTTLTASVMDVGEDMAGSLTIKWYKDGAAAGIGVSLLVKAADISGKAVYRYEALEGTKVRGTCEVTVSNVTDGAEGTGIQSITEEYYLSTSKESLSGGSWVTSPPTWSAGKYMWTRKKTVYKNPTSIVYTTPLCDSSWEAVNEMQIGGRNLARKTNQGVTNWRWNMQTGDRTITEVVENGIRCCKFLRGSTAQSGWSVIMYSDIGRDKLEAGKQYTISFEVKGSVSTTFNAFFKNSGGQNELIESSQVINRTIIANEWSKCTYVVTLKDTLPTATDQGLYLMSMNSDTGVSYIFRNLKIEKGSNASDWTPAPEDIQDQIDSTVNILNDLVSDSKLTPNEKVIAKKEWLIIADEYPKYIAQANAYKVSTTAYTNAYNALNSYLNTTNSGVIFNMTTTTDISSSIFTSIFKTYYNCKVELVNAVNTAKAKYEADQITVGARNIIAKTATWNDHLDWGISHFNGNEVTMTGSVGTTSGVSFTMPITDYGFKRLRNAELTFSMDYIIDSKITYGTTSPWVGVQLSVGRNTDTGGSSQHFAWYGNKTFPTEVITEWKRYSVTWKISDYDVVSSAMTFFMRDAGGTVRFRNPKLELGNKATDWSPAPEDIQEQLDNCVTDTNMEYYLSTSTTSLENGEWVTIPPLWVDGKHMWIRTTKIYGDGTIEITDPACIAGAQGIPGIPGIDGKTPYLHIAYANSADGNTGFSVSDSTNKLYIGQYTDYTSADSTDPTKYSWTKIKGDTGAQGPQGIQGPKGEDGKTYYTWLKYADSPTTGMSDDPTGKSYIGLAYNKTTATESSNYSDYAWSLIKGAKGDQGVAGGKGADGKTFYTWIKYATSSTGANMSDSPTGKSYIGLAYNKTTATESTNAADYMWSLIKGDKGDPGDKGETGIIVSATAPTNPTVGQLWQTATKQPIKRWDGSAWVVHYISVDNLDVENLSAISANLGTVTAGMVRNQDSTVEFNVTDGEIISSTAEVSSVYPNGRVGYPAATFSGGGIRASLYANKDLTTETNRVEVNGGGFFINGSDVIEKINSNLEYKTYNATNVNANIGNKSIIIKANAYDCKINGFMYLNPATYDNDTILFKTPLTPSATIYFSTTVAGRGFKVLTDGSVRANGSYTVSSATYVYFGVSFAIKQGAG